MGGCRDTENESLNNCEMLLLLLTLLLLVTWSSPSRNCIRCPGVVGKTILNVQMWSKEQEVIWEPPSHYSMVIDVFSSSVF